MTMLVGFVVFLLMMGCGSTGVGGPDAAVVDMRPSRPDLYMPCFSGCDSPNLCMVGRCDGSRNLCLYSPAPDGTVCGGGRCYNGQCCSGCWDATSNTCQSGKDVAACGVAGGICSDCSSNKTCIQDSCTMAGTCSHVPTGYGTACVVKPNVPGICRYGSCDSCGGAGQYCCAGDACTTQFILIAAMLALIHKRHTS
jgi:hypothetical protein